MRARCSIVERNDQDNIVFLQDMSDQYGSRTITNDAEAVVNYYRTIYGNRVRVVYRGTDNEWWEIVWTIERHRDTPAVFFKPWNGLAWDILSRKEQV